MAVPGLDMCVALLAYDEISRRLISQLKYGCVRSGVGWIAAALASQAASLEAEFDVVTWLPAAKRNKRRRGFDQCEVLARPLSRRVGVPARRLLRRSDQRGQTGQSRSDRLVGPSLSAIGSCEGLSVLLIDDVMTTGASLRAGAVALRTAGAASVAGLVVAHRRFR